MPMHNKANQQAIDVRFTVDNCRIWKPLRQIIIYSPKAHVTPRSRRTIFHQFRHPGESRDPGFRTGSDGNLTDWVPAFAGTTAYVKFWVFGRPRFAVISRREEGAMRDIVTDEQRRNRPKVGLPEGPGRFRSGDCVVRRSHSPRYAPSSRLVGAPKSPRPNRVLFTQASLAAKRRVPGKGTYFREIGQMFFDVDETKQNGVAVVRSGIPGAQPLGI